FPRARRRPRAGRRDPRPGHESPERRSQAHRLPVAVPVLRPAVPDPRRRRGLRPPDDASRRAAPLRPPFPGPPPLLPRHRAASALGAAFVLATILTARIVNDLGVNFWRLGP